MDGHGLREFCGPPPSKDIKFYRMTLGSDDAPFIPMCRFVRRLLRGSVVEGVELTKVRLRQIPCSIDFIYPLSKFIANVRRHDYRIKVVTGYWNIEIEVNLLYN
ncbi:hypothetical protein CKAN_01468100 [Cinnamomum micranthum f. kanehirae]|uniref:Uncharacterized protein n=1 Tax=Cinnamomum micranthum f. kanehirae TaxID=337451 RepID=A0A3S3MLE4_9MAGN|nr:hypothetical protein CKAN_01468100 [Cinnamomum micranthum f. kanehirae]